MATDFCRLFSVKHPVVLAPMGRVGTPELVAAVSNAGGLGLAPLWVYGPDKLRSEVRRIRDLTDKPFGVNLNMDFRNDDQLDICLDEGVDILSLFWGDTGDFVGRAKAAGAKVIITASTAADATEAVALGADAICAQGWEAGGHVEGTVSTMALVPAVVDAVGDVPVIAAGGIADGRGLAAVLALGASAAWIGTRFLSAKEASVHPEYLARLLAATENDTGHYDNLYDIDWPNAPHRTLKNSTSAMWEAAGKPPLGQRPGEGDMLARRPDGGEVFRYESASPYAELKGEIEAVSMWSGQGVGLVREVQPAAEIVREIVEEAGAVIRSLR
ncbi:nitronate monooxygenase [Rhodovulum iodosum]|uniref:Nitronate monooxygenase n=1 Tax=Rhodovulum iodosum TaxID=68291 RepID=A0ABV3XT50_9RHOB|nr:nitronate monooxygenase [Rhodovulum robiginosum]RSK30581.1 nitronate monooxygenase [Rhodovulum robiginosum]